MKCNLSMLIKEVNLCKREDVSFDLQSESYKLFDMFKDRISEKMKLGFLTFYIIHV